ncbi:MAG: radical SAM protein, partial [Candidatus Hodarchaeota archaeon]
IREIKRWLYSMFEPFKEQKFWEIAKAARNILPKSQIEIFSNGTLITPKIASEISKLGFKMAISLHGFTKTVHESITRVPDSFQRALRGVQALHDIHIPIRTECIAWNPAQFDPNFISRYFSFVKSKFPKVKIGLPRPILPIGRATKSPYNLENIPLQVPRFSLSYSKFLEHNSLNPCWGRRCAILASGEVVPCIFARNRIFGSLKSNSFSLKEIVLKQEVRKITKTEVSVCKKCEFRFLCHDCRVLASAFEDSLYAPPPTCAYNPLKGIWKNPKMPIMPRSRPVIILLENQDFLPV